jgi:hypothetical protein
MTVITTTDRSAWQLANGVVTQWVYAFKSDFDDDLILIVQDIATGSEATVVSNAFTVVKGVDNIGGTVTYPTNGLPLPTGKRIMVKRVTPLTQPLLISNQGPQMPENIMMGLDRIVMQVQEMKETLAAAVAGVSPPLSVSSAMLQEAAVTTSKISDNAVTTAKVANNAITTAKLANGTANSLLGYNGSGVATGVTVGSGLALSGGTLTAGIAAGSVTRNMLENGTANSLLGYNGSGGASVVTIQEGVDFNLGALMVYGSLRPLLRQQITVSQTQSAFNLNFLSGASWGLYKQYLVLLSNLIPTVASSFLFQASDDGANTFYSGANTYDWAGYFADTGGIAAQASGNDTKIGLTSIQNVGIGANQGLCGQILITLANSQMRVQSKLSGVANSMSQWDIAGRTKTAATYNGFRLYFGSLIASGEISIYGVRP